jgi:hypothetical protein
VEEEADESQFWLELLSELDEGATEYVSQLQEEAHELASIIVASKKTARKQQ